MAAAAAVATIRTIREEKLLDNARARGQQLMAGLRRLQEEYPQLGDVRGLGLMIGCEFRTLQGKPDGRLAKAVLQGWLKRRLLLLTCGPWGNTVRLIPPLIVGESQVAEALGVLEEALAEATT